MKSNFEMEYYKILFCPYMRFLEIYSIILTNEINGLIKPMNRFKRLQLSIKIESMN